MVMLRVRVCGCGGAAIVASQCFVLSAVDRRELARANGGFVGLLVRPPCKSGATATTIVAC